jgi:uncharacterized membrane protein
MDRYGWFAGWNWVFWIFLAAFIIAIFAGIGSSRRRRRLPPGSTDQSALDALDARLARGEITREEYERRKRAILDRNVA